MSESLAVARPPGPRPPPGPGRRPRRSPRAARGTARGGAASPGDTASAGCGPADPASGRRQLAPRRAVLCKIAMGITMGYMLILML
jgi:hypothetical protein